MPQQQQNESAAEFSEEYFLQAAAELINMLEPLLSPFLYLIIKDLWILYGEKSLRKCRFHYKMPFIYTWLNWLLGYYEARRNKSINKEKLTHTLNEKQLLGGI